MLDRVQVSYNLRKLDSLFKKAIKSPRTYREANLYSKLAILEACGWVEKCSEQIFTDFFRVHLRERDNISAYEYIIANNHGFEYKKYLRTKLSQNLIGLILLEKTETVLERKQTFNDMKASMGSLTAKRGELAHSHTQIGGTGTVQTVDLTRRQLNQVYEGLKVLEKQLNKIRFN